MVIGAALLLSALTMAGAPAAVAASPQDICADLADGHVDGTYTNAEWTAYFSDPTIQGYGCGGITAPVTPGASAPAPVTVVVGVQGAAHTAGTPTAGTPTAGTPTTGVQGAQHTVNAPVVNRSAAAPLGTTRTSGTLPFTGAQLTLFALVGLALVAAGLVLRSTGRPAQRR